MRKIILTTVLLLAICTASNAQTNSTNFTSSDCTGQEHTLFTELDAGKVVVMVWVMPCGSCTTPAKNAYAVVQEYESSYPGKVLYYLIDDEGNTNCTSLNNWANTNNISADATFSDATISMNDYGTPGMPKVVVTGGPEHTIYFNKNGSAAGNSASIQAAIDNALGLTGITNGTGPVALKVYPNPAIGSIVAEYSHATTINVEVELLNTLGQRVRYELIEDQPAGTYQYKIETAGLERGIYLVKINGNTVKAEIK